MAGTCRLYLCRDPHCTCKPGVGVLLGIEANRVESLGRVRTDWLDETRGLPWTESERSQHALWLHWDADPKGNILYQWSEMPCPPLLDYIADVSTTAPIPGIESHSRWVKYTKGRLHWSYDQSMVIVEEEDPLPCSERSQVPWVGDELEDHYDLEVDNNAKENQVPERNEDLIATEDPKDSDNLEDNDDPKGNGDLEVNDDLVDNENQQHNDVPVAYEDI